METHPPHPFTSREKEFLPFFKTLGFEAIDGFFCGGWDATNTRGDVCTLLLQSDSLVLVQADRPPQSVDLPYGLRLPARELLHKEKLIAQKNAPSMSL